MALQNEDFSGNNLLKPTEVRVDLKMSNQAHRDQFLNVDVSVDQISLNADFKDMQLLIRYYNIYERLLKPSIERALESLNLKVYEETKKVAMKRFEEAIDFTQVQKQEVVIYKGDRDPQYLKRIEYPVGLILLEDENVVYSSQQ